MEENILGIIQENYNYFTGTNEAEIAAAKEIASHFREFIEWIGFSIRNTKSHGNLFYREISNTWFYSKTFIIEPKEYTLDELYTYYLKEVKK